MYYKIPPFKVCNPVFLTFTDTCNYHHSQFYSISVTSKRNPTPASSFSQFLLFFKHWQSLSTFHVDNPPLLICLFWTFHTKAIIRYVAFYICLILLRITFLRFIHVVACINISFHFKAE